MEDKHSLKGKVAVVTGSSSGIGAAIALELAASQAHVIVHARSSQAEGERVVAAVREHGVESTLMLADTLIPSPAKDSSTKPGNGERESTSGSITPVPMS